MVKFYAKDYKKPKKPTDFRLVAYQQLLGIIKAKHLKYINRIVKSLKEAQDPLKQNLLNDHKQIKNQQLRLLSIYLMIKQLPHFQLESLQHHLQFQIPSREHLLTSIEQDPKMCQFIQNIMKSTLFVNTLNKLQELWDEVGKKKLILKEKNKQRKAKKKLKKEQKQIEPEEIIQPEKEDEKEEEKEEEQEEIFQEQVVVKEKKKNFKEIQETKKRTQFIKKGRNKAIQEKRQKKKWKAREPIQDQQPKKQRKQKLHPSWQAKIQEKMFIKPFQGKKIML